MCVCGCIMLIIHTSLNKLTLYDIIPLKILINEQIRYENNVTTRIDFHWLIDVTKTNDDTPAGSKI